MHRVFVEPSQIDEEGRRITISGSEVNHIKNVLRMKRGEELDACESISRRLYRCIIDEVRDDVIECKLCFIKEADTELSSRILLFQGLAKGERMELAVQKSVELGAAAFYPVSCHRSVVKLDEKKGDKKRERWQLLAEGAAAQSRRAFVPEVGKVMDFSESLEHAAKEADRIFIPYELEQEATMEDTRRLFSQIKPGETIAVFIGPEGGFEEEEVEQAVRAGAVPITLGRRILRTETAAIAVLAWLSYVLG